MNTDRNMLLEMSQTLPQLAATSLQHYYVYFYFRCIVLFVVLCKSSFNCSEVLIFLNIYTHFATHMTLEEHF